MRLAADVNGARLTATPEAHGYCPGCGARLIAKCGSIVAWHWAHIATADCDPWAEPDSRWHLDWQDLVPPERREVIMGQHRADIVSPDGVVVELQHSNISEAEIRQREAHYGRMAWIFDATEPYQSGRLLIRQRDGYVTFRWKHVRKSIAACRQTVFLDLGNGTLVRVHKISTEAPCGGWGKVFHAQQIISWLNPGMTVPEIVCKVDETAADIPGLRTITARCGRCDHVTAWSYPPALDSREPSVRRCLSLMREECPRGDRNFYMAGHP